MTKLAVRLGAAAMLLATMAAQAQNLESMGCGSLANGYGPYDYSNAAHRRDYLNIVEVNHFNDDVFSLRRGITGHSPLGDLDYTLRAFPNHYLALDAMARLHRREKVERMPSGRYTIDCWFERAIAFRPSDGNVRLVRGIHLFRTGSYEAAESEFLEGLRILPNSAEGHYNIGLLYLQMKDYEKAREHARRAYELGYPLPGLRQKLVRAGQWDVE